MCARRLIPMVLYVLVAGRADRGETMSRKTIPVAVVLTLVAASFAAVQPAAFAAPPSPCETDAPDRPEPEIIEWDRQERRVVLEWRTAWQSWFDCRDDSADGLYEIAERADIECLGRFWNCHGSVKATVRRFGVEGRTVMEGGIRGQGSECSSDGTGCTLQLDSRLTGEVFSGQLAHEVVLGSDPEQPVEMVTINFARLVYSGESGGLND